VSPSQRAADGRLFVGRQSRVDEHVASAPFLEVDGPQDPFERVAAALRDPPRGHVVRIPAQLEPLESASEAPFGQPSKRLGRRAPTPSLGREDVAELGLVRLLIDSHGDGDPEERAVLGVDDREAFSGSIFTSELVGLQP